MPKGKSGGRGARNDIRASKKLISRAEDLKKKRQAQEKRLARSRRAAGTRGRRPLQSLSNRSGK